MYDAFITTDYQGTQISQNWESGLHVLEICFVEVGARGGGGEDRDVMDFSCGQCPRRYSGKEFACNAGDTGDSGSIPGLGRSPGGANATHSSILTWKVPWAEEFTGLQRVGHNWAHMQNITVIFESTYVFLPNPIYLSPI